MMTSSANQTCTGALATSRNALARQAGSNRPMTVTRVLATTHEINLKGGNRIWFERKLQANIRRALGDLPLERLSRPQWRVLLSFSEAVPFAEVARRLATVFGINSFMPVEHAGYTIEEVSSTLDTWLERYADRREPTFAIRCQRSDKTFPQTSIDVERAVGEHVRRSTGWKVDLGAPQITFHLLLDQHGFWLWERGIVGPGGLPVGSGSRATCLVSGGIDSPVAAWLLMKRGMRIDFVHFHSVPQTDSGSLAKVEDLIRVLNRYQPSARVAMVPLLPIQLKIIEHCPVEYRVLLYRRFMMRIGERLARRLKTRALVTGESLGQVASQTLENMTSVQAAIRMPVLRPLIGLDKQEIINLARRIGSFGTSVLPHDDCCALHVPDRPATRSRSGELEVAEQALDIEGLVAEALRQVEIGRVTEAVPWDQIPPPREAIR